MTDDRLPTRTQMIELLRFSRAEDHRPGARAQRVADLAVRRWPSCAPFRNRLYDWALATLTTWADLPLPCESPPEDAQSPGPPTETARSPRRRRRRSAKNHPPG